MALPKELDELKTLPQWVGFSLKWDEKKQKDKKIPICPVHAVLQYAKDKKEDKKEDKYGKGAMADNPASWGTFDQALQLMNERRYVKGIGFEFANGYAGIDIDHCIDQNGNINEMAAEIIRIMDSYTEYSPSKTGVHILFKTTKPPFRGFRNDNIGLEIYNSGRFFTITGEPYGPVKPVNERTAQLNQVIDKFFPKSEKPAERPYNNTVAAFRSDVATRDIWANAFKSANGMAIKALYNGQIEGYESQSSADLALCNHLAYWANGDKGLMDKMFRESALYREKWERDDYRNWTLDKALENFTPYVPNNNYSNSRNHSLQSNNNVWATDENGQIIEANEQLEQETPQQTALRVKFEENPQPDSIESYLNAETFKGDLERFRQYADRKTGFKYLDELTTLYPGMYAVGAISSLGKTTFLHQLADQLAERGEHVLFFSLEQSRLELFSKGVARASYIKAQNEHKGQRYNDVKYHAVSAIKVRSGKYNERAVDLDAIIKQYAADHKNVSIVECGFDTKIGDITSYVEHYIEANQVKPIVIVDYLQIIQPDDLRQQKKDVVDSHVRALKMLQKDNDLVLFLICSLNRAAYLSPVDFESFKETGGIEYTADVVWGLDLAVMEQEADLFEKSDKKIEKRNAIKSAKLEVPRKVDLKCLKNRYGQSSYTSCFNYYPENDYFENVTNARNYFMNLDDEITADPKAKKKTATF